MGAVDNKTSNADPTTPDNTTVTTIKLSEDLMRMLKLIAGIALLFFIIFAIRPVFDIVVFILKAIIWVISLPFKALKTIFGVFRK